MRASNRIGIAGNRKRLGLLRAFRSDVLLYFQHSRPSSFGDGRIDDDVAVEARRKINLNLDEVARVLRAAGVSSTFIYRDAPIAGGRVSRFDLVHNIFNLTSHEISHAQLLDCVDRGIGEYERGDAAARWRSANPLFWLGLGIEWMVQRPFVWLGRAGFDQSAIESSVVGRIARFVLTVVGAVASVVTILEVAGLLKPALKALGLQRL